MEMTEADLMRRKFFDDHAEGWEDHNYTPEVLARTEAIIGRVDLKEGMTVLDVGCGLGVLQPFLRRRVGKAGRLAMLDFSPKMIAGAARRHPDSWPLLARAEEIPLPDAFVDVVICFSAFPHVSDKPAAAREFLRVLRPGGAAYVLHVNGREKLNAMHGATAP